MDLFDIWLSWYVGLDDLCSGGKARVELMFEIQVFGFEIRDLKGLLFPYP